jgi:hypothetical protein
MYLHIPSVYEYTAVKDLKIGHTLQTECLEKQQSFGETYYKHNKSSHIERSC